MHNRCTFAIISHPDAGKTTMTEKLLLLGGQLQLAGTVKSRKSGQYAASDWMEVEKERGISVTTSVMQFPYKDKIINLLDTPGHEDFSEDTYRTLTAVDSALMVIDAAKGVETRTIKLMEVCRLRDTPIWTFVNKIDRDMRDPMELLDQVEQTLNIQCAPMTWPIGSGQQCKGIYHLYRDAVILYETGHGHHLHDYTIIKDLDNPILDQILGEWVNDLREEIKLVRGASHTFDKTEYLAGRLTPVYFGSALSHFGVKEMLDEFILSAPAPQPQQAEQRLVQADEKQLTGFVFKIQANMDRRHHDRIAFLRICSGQYRKGMKLKHVRIDKMVKVSNAVTFLAGARNQAEQAETGDIIGLHNHGTVQIGDTFTENEVLKFIGIPNFSPELFRRVQLKDPLKMKALQKGLTQLSEEGAAQIFRPLISHELIIGAVGALQFDVVARRLLDEYTVECSYDNIQLHCVRWVECHDAKIMAEFKQKYLANLAEDTSGHLTYLVPSSVNLTLTQQRFPDVKFHATREH